MQGAHRDCYCRCFVLNFGKVSRIHNMLSGERRASKLVDLAIAYFNDARKGVEEPEGVDKDMLITGAKEYVVPEKKTRGRK